MLGVHNLNAGVMRDANVCPTEENLTVLQRYVSVDCGSELSLKFRSDCAGLSQFVAVRRSSS